jgi:hypothetical protein
VLFIADHLKYRNARIVLKLQDLFGKMPAIVKLQLSLEAFAEAISSLNLEEKRQLQEIIEQQIFEAEEALYSDDVETQAEIQAVRAEYAVGEYATMDEYLAKRLNQE